MRNESIRIATVIIVFGIFLFSLACGTGTREANRGESQDQDYGRKHKGDDDVSLDADDPSCDEENIDRKVERVKNKLESKLEEAGLKSDIKFDVRKVEERYLEILIEGRARHKDKINDLTNILRRFMRRKCVLRVVFVKDGTIDSLEADSAARIEGFRWFGCEEPKQPCPDGECRQNC